MLSRIAILAGMLSAVTLPIGVGAHAGQKHRSAFLFQDQTPALLKRGYVELSGGAAASFLVGNTVVIKRSDTPKGIARYANDISYYFSDSNAAYECAGNDCWTTSWKIDGTEICFEFPERCDDATDRFYLAPRILKAPRPDRRGGIGIYLTYKSIIHAVVAGNATIAPLLEPGGDGRLIEIDAADFAQEIEVASKFSGRDWKLPVTGARAVSFLIGNTFMSGETAVDDRGVHPCPVQGTYYSPDGRIIRFNCYHWPDSWGMHITHWKMESRELCVEDLSGNGQFGCGDRFERLYLAPSDQHDKWHVIAEDFPRKIVGYAGNVFHFK